jgi:hypothetical protein
MNDGHTMRNLIIKILETLLAWARPKPPVSIQGGGGPGEEHK